MICPSIPFALLINSLLSLLKNNHLVKTIGTTILLLALGSTLFAQDTITLIPGSYELKETGASHYKTQAFAKPANTVLKAGLYQSIDRHTHTIFNVNDAGFLQGEMKILSSARLQQVSQWENGQFLRGYQYSYDNGRLMQESFDSLVAVFLYDSTANRWDSAMLTVRVRKEYSGEGDWLLFFTRRAGHAYALCQFRQGKMVSRSYPDMKLEIYNGKGEVSFREVHNWKLKQIETTSFTDTATWKNITTNKNISWNSNGTISYLPVGDAGYDKQSSLYRSGKLVKREVFKNNTRTITEYDDKGKIKSKETYKLPKVKYETLEPA